MIHFLDYIWKNIITTIIGLRAFFHIKASSDLVGHGDWVLKAFCDQLADPSRTEILAIDMDFTTFEDFNYLFEDDPSQNGIQNYFNAVVDEFWNTLDHEVYHYVVSGLSVSLTSHNIINLRRQLLI